MALHCNVMLALHYTVLYCRVQCRTALHFTALHFTALHSTSLHCTVQQITALHFTALHGSAQHCTVCMYM